MRICARKLVQATSVLIGLLVLLSIPASGLAANPPDSTIAIASLKTDDFPLMRLRFTPRAADRTVVKNLTIDDVYLIEDGLERVLERMALIEPGLQVIIALNPGEAINYYVGGTTRYANLRAALQSFLSAQADRDKDDFSLVIASEALAARAGDPAEISSLLADYNPAWAAMTPSLDSLSAALDLCNTPNPRADMQRVILYITPISGENTLADLRMLTHRAVSAGVRVFVWLVAYNTSQSSPETAALEELAHRTNGEFFFYTGVESLPDPDAWFEPWRSFYSAEYLSAIDESGTHSLVIGTRDEGGSIQSAPITFDLNIQAPIASFVNPPQSIIRTQVANQPLEELRLDYLIQFPDGYAREIRSVSLLVDGEQTLTDIDEPFDQFLWSPPADPLAESHTLQLRVTDSLGLTSNSPVVDIAIELQTAARTMVQQWFASFRGTRLIIFIAVVLSAAALVTVLVLSSRGYRLRLGKRPSRKDQRDPLKQQVPIGIEPEKKTSPPMIKPPLAGNSSYAQLVPLTSVGQTNALIKPFPLSRAEHVIGSDAKLVDILVKSTSVEPVHSRITYKGESGVFVADCRTKTGTWVNYAPVSEAGTRLEHNDIVSFGKIAYRFELIRQPAGSNPI